MGNPWYREHIQELIRHLGLEKGAPYSYWRSGLFEATDPAMIPDAVDARMMDVAATMATWERVRLAGNLGGSPQDRAAVSRARAVTELYVCLVYPRQTALQELARKLPRGCAERQLCDTLSGKDSPFRHIRNSLAHGSWESTAQGVRFEDRDSSGKGTVWAEERDFGRLHLDCLLVLDVLMSAYARRHPEDLRGAATPPPLERD